MKKRSVTLKGHPTSITLEDEFWMILKSIAEKKKQSIASLINDIDENRIERQSAHGLSSAIRVYVLNWVIKSNG